MREQLRPILDLCSDFKSGNNSLSPIFDEIFVFGEELTLKVLELTFNFNKTIFLL